MESTKKSPVPMDPKPEQMEQAIRLRAFELYEARKKEEGHDLDDWLQAENELTRKKIRAVAA